MPPPAQILWTHLESVFTRQGEVRHRVRNQISNLRLQFLALELPEGAEVWSVFVAGRPRRLYHRDRRLYHRRLYHDLHLCLRLYHRRPFLILLPL